MTVDISRLAVSVESQGADELKISLEGLAVAGERAERATEGLATASVGANTGLSTAAVAAERAGRAAESLANGTSRARVSVEDILPGFANLRSHAEALRVQADTLAGGLQNTAGAADGLAASGTVASRATGLLGAGVSALVTRLAGLASIGAVIAGFNNAVQSAGQLQASLRSTGAIADLTVEDLARLEQSASSLGSSTIFSAGQIGAAFRDIAADAGALGDTTTELESLTQASVTLATATGTQLPQASSALLQVMRQFRAGTEDADRFIQVLAELGPTAGELQEAVAALNGAGDVAAVLGISVEQTAASIQLLAKAGIEGGEAGAGLKLIFSQLESQTNSQLRPSIVGLEQALRNASAEGLIFEGRGLAIGRVLSGQVDELAATTREFSTLDTATRLAAEASQSYEGQTQALKAQLATLATTIGTALLPSVTGAVTGLNNLLTVSRQISDLPPLFPSEEVGSAEEYAASLRQVTSSMADTAGTVAQLGVGLQVLGEILNIKLGEDIGGRIDEILAAAEQRTARILDLAARADGEVLDKGPSTRRAEPRAPQVVDTAAEQAQTAAILEEIRQRNRSQLEAEREAAEADIRALEARTNLTDAQEQQRKELILAIRRDLAAKEAEIDAKSAATARRARDEAAKEAAESLKNQASARNFDATVNLTLAEGDPIAQDKIREEQRLSQLKSQGDLLVQQGVKNQQELDGQLAAVSAQSAQQQTLREADLLRQRDARLIQLQAEGQANEFEAERQRLEASLLMRQEAIIREAGSVDAGLKLIADIKERGLADIAKREEQAAERDRQLAARTRQEKLQNVASTMVGLANLIGAGTDKITGIQRAAALASVLINIPETASDAYKFGTKAGGPVLGAAWAALSVAAQVGYASQLGGGGGGASSGGGVPAASSVQYASAGQNTYTESTTGDAPDLATLKRSERIEQEQLVAAVTAPASIPVEGGPIPIERATLVIDEPEWDLPALTVNTPNLSAQPASVRIETPEVSLPASPAQRVLSADGQRAAASVSVAVAAPAPARITASQAAPAQDVPEQRATTLQAQTLPSLRVQQPGDIRLSAPTFAPLAVESPAPVRAQAAAVSTQIQREIRETLDRRTEVTATSTRADSSATSTRTTDSVTRLATATETLVSRTERDSRVSVEERTRETVATRVEAQERAGTPPRPLREAPATLAPRTDVAGQPVGPIEFEAPTLQLAAPEVNLPALSVTTPLLTAQPASVTIETPTIVLPRTPAQQLASTAAEPRAARAASLNVTGPGDIQLQAPAVPALSLAAPRLPALTAASLPAAPEADDAAPLEFNAPTLELSEPTWSLPALEVNTPSVTIAPTSVAAQSLREPAQVSRVAPAALDRLTVTPPSLRTPEDAELPATGGPESIALAVNVPSPGLRDAPSDAEGPVGPGSIALAVNVPEQRGRELQPVIPDLREARRADSRSGGITVNVINQGGTRVDADVSTSTGPDGEQFIEVVLGRLARDVDQNGPAAQAIARRFGLQPRLGSRG